MKPTFKKEIIRPSLFLLAIMLTSKVCCVAQTFTPVGVDSLLEVAYRLRSKDKDKAISLAETAIESAEESSYKKGMATGYNIIGIVNRDKGMLEEALPYFEKSLTIRFAEGDTIGGLGSLNNMAALIREQGDYPKAISMLLDGLKILYRLKSDNTMRSKFFSNLSSCYQYEGDYENALKYGYLHHEMSEIVNDSLGVNDSKYNIALILYRCKRYFEASKYLPDVIEFFRRNEEWEGEAMALDLLAQIELGLNNFAKSETFFLQCIELYTVNDPSNIHLFGTLVNLGELKLATNQFHAARTYYNKAKIVLGSKGGWDDRSVVYDGLARCYNHLGVFDSAYYYQTESKRFQDSIYSKEKATAIAEMQTKYETAEKERLASEAQLLAEKATARSRTFLALFIAALAVAGSLFLYFRHRQRTAALIAEQQEQLHLKEVEELLMDQEIKSINAVLEGQETERIRIAKDLHDRLGSMLTTAKWGFESYLEEHSGTERVEPLVKSTLLLDDAYQEVRRIAHDMVSGVLTKFGLVPAVEELCNAINDSKRLQVKLITFGMEARPDNNVEVVLYRVIQELLSNILKHAKASLVTIQIGRIEQELTVSVEDNGIGFDPDLAKNGMGLKNIEARVNGLNGSVFFDTGKGNGTSVIIDVPV